MADFARIGFARRHPVWTATLLVLAALLIALAVVLSNIQWLREPLQRAIAANLDREVTIGDMHLGWSGQPTL